jgi:hypothetical protein
VGITLAREMSQILLLGLLVNSRELSMMRANQMDGHPD